MEKVKQNEETKPVGASPSDDSVGKLESMSDEEYQAMVLEYVRASDKQLIDPHFKRGKAFKASLDPSKKQKFTSDVRKAYDKLLATPGMKDELSSLQKRGIRRSAESMVVEDWRVKDSID